MARVITSPEGDSMDELDSLRGWLAVGCAFVSMFICFGVVYSFGAFFDPMSAEFKAGSSATSAVFSITTFIFFTGGIVSGMAADRFGPKWPTVVTFSVLVAGIFGVGILSGSLWGVFASGALGLAAAWSLSTLLPSLVAEVTVPRVRGRVLGWIHLWWSLAMGVGSMAGGAMFEFEARLPFIVSGALNVVSIGLALRFFQQVSRRRARLR